MTPGNPAHRTRAQQLTAAAQTHGWTRGMGVESWSVSAYRWLDDGRCLIVIGNPLGWWWRVADRGHPVASGDEPCDTADDAITTAETAAEATA